jgi:methionine-rich copper-binding protein CopC
MSARARRLGVVTVLAGAVAALACGAAAPSAFAHASLVAMSPAANRVASHTPGRLALTFSEVVEPRFAAISVTDARGRRLGRGAPVRSAADPRTIVRRLGRMRPAARGAARQVPALGARPADGRQLGRDVRGHPARRRAVLAPARRPREGMTRRRDPRLLVAASVVAVLVAFAAVLVVVLLARAVLAA